MASGIIAAGNWIVDKVKMIDRWPGEGELCNVVGQESGWGGGPCNVLFDLAALGVEIPLEEALRFGAAGAWFNLHSATASDGAPTLEQAKAHLDTCTFNTMAWFDQ